MIKLGLRLSLSARAAIVAPATSLFLLEDGTSQLLLEDNSNLLLE